MELKDQYFFDFFILRTPLLPYTNCSSFIGHFGESPEALQETIGAYLSHPVIREALYIASPALSTQLERFANKEISKPRAIRKLAESIYEYYVRMCTRCTPFGIFAGCTYGTFSDETEIVLSPYSEMRRKIRLDMDCASHISRLLLQSDTVKEKIIYYTNNGIYTVGNKYRNTEYRYDRNNTRTHHIVSIDKTEALSFVLKICRNGLPYQEIIEKLQGKGFSGEECREYVSELIANQILISELEPNITGPDYITRITDLLSGRPGADHDLLPFLSSLNTLFHEINHAENRIAQYQSIYKDFRNHHGTVAENRLFQVDLYKPAEKSVLDRRIAGQVLEGVEVLRKLNPVDLSKLQLNFFKKAFIERYEQRVVPLSEAMDTEIGLGYKGALSTADHYHVQNGVDYTTQQDFKIKKYQQWIQNNSGSIIITDEDIRTLPPNPNLLANSFSATISLMEKGEQEQRFFLKSTSGPSGANLIGRFAHSEAMIEENLSRICREEADLDKEFILAEIVHLPQARVGNVLSRPVLRKYEIPYLALSVLDSRYQIRVEDLYLMVRNNRLILFSAKHQKEVIPRLSTAHNFNNGLPLYNFLCDLQFQYIQPGASWDWGLLRDYSRLPRVEYKNIVLSPATWHLKKNELQDILKVHPSAEAQKKFGEFRQKYRIPDQVILVESDNWLLMDLTNSFLVNYLLKLLSERPALKLVENVYESTSGLVRNDQGHLTNEVVIPFTRKKESYVPVQENPQYPQTTDKIVRKFPPGSEWLYIKLYTSFETADNTLVQHVFPVLSKLENKGQIIQWFFLRYADPMFHIRIRVNLANPSDAGLVLHELRHKMRSLIETNVVWKIQLDTYVREIERYGGNTMPLSEELFCINSNLVYKLLKIPGVAADNNAITLSLLAGVDSMLNTFGLTLDQKISLTRNGSASYAMETGLRNRPALKESLSTFYRGNSKLIEQLLHMNESMNGNGQANGSQPLYFPLLIKRCREISAPLKKTATGILTLCGDDEKKLNNLLYSYIHMFVNRMLAKYYQAQELKIFYVLHKVYTSRLVRISKTHP